MRFIRDKKMHAIANAYLYTKIQILEEFEDLTKEYTIHSYDKDKITSLINESKSCILLELVDKNVDMLLLYNSESTSEEKYKLFEQSGVIRHNKADLVALVIIYEDFDSREMASIFIEK